LQQRVRSVRLTLDEALEGTMSRIRTFALEEIAKVADEKGVGVVLAQSQVVIARDVFDLFPDVLDTADYPPRADQLDDYDYLMHFEDIEAVPGGTNMPLGEVFSKCLHTPHPESPPAIHVPDDVSALQVRRL